MLGLLPNQYEMRPTMFYVQLLYLPISFIVILASTTRTSVYTVLVKLVWASKLEQSCWLNPA